MFVFFVRSTKNFQKKYGLRLTAATFLIIDYNEASMQIACEWQKCIGDTINLVSPLKCGTEEKKKWDDWKVQYFFYMVLLGMRKYTKRKYKNYCTKFLLMFS